MGDAPDIVNETVGSDNPEHYVDWLGKKTDFGRAGDQRFGMHIHTTGEDVIEQNAKESGVVTDDAFWKQHGFTTSKEDLAEALAET